MLDSGAMRIAIIAVLTFVSVACSKKEPAAPSEPASAAEAPSTEGVPPSLAKDVENIQLEELPEELKGETPAIGATPSIKVIEPGAEPRTALRFQVPPGFSQKATIDVGYALEAVVIVLAISNPEYVVSFDLAMRAKKAKAKGAVRVSFEAEGTRLDVTKQTSTKRVEAIKKAHEGAKKLTGSYTLSPRGQITDVTVKIPDGSPQESHDIADNLRVALLQMTPALPEEPVGKGATWTAHEGISQGGVHVNQLRSFELANLENGIATLEVEVEQSAAPQPYSNPGKPMPLELQVLSGEGEAALTWDFTKLTPTRADIESNDLRGIRQQIMKDGQPQAADAVARSTRTVDIGPKAAQ